MSQTLPPAACLNIPYFHHFPTFLPSFPTLVPLFLSILFCNFFSFSFFPSLYLNPGYPVSNFLWAFSTLPYEQKQRIQVKFHVLSMYLKLCFFFVDLLCFSVLLFLEYVTGNCVSFFVGFILCSYWFISVEMCWCFGRVSPKKKKIIKEIADYFNSYMVELYYSSFYYFALWAGLLGWSKWNDFCVE